MSSIGELPHPELVRLPDDVRKVILELGQNMPPNSWTIESTVVTGTPRTDRFFLLNVELRGKQGVINRLLKGEKDKSLRIITPNTMVVGLYPRNQRQLHTDRYGMFSLLKTERYNPGYVVAVLDGTPNDVPNHNPIDLMKVTGRYRGDVSPIIGQGYLEGFTTVEFSEDLVSQASDPHTAVAYPLGGNDLLYYVVKGSDFLVAYQGLLSRIGVKNNLRTGNVTDQVVPGI